ncbi:MAG: tetratricopeptide repeat protein [Rikenellaceae bacterium]
MKIKTLILSSLLLCVSFVAGAQSISDAVAKFTEAQELAKQKKFGESLPVLEEALEMAEAIEGDGAMALSDDIKSMIPQVCMFDGVMSVQAKDFKGGIAKLEKAEKLAKQYGNSDVRRKAARYASTAYMAMGIESFNEKDFATALEIFKQGYTSDPQNFQLASYTAKAYAETGDLDNAMKLYGEVIAAGESNSRYADMASDAKSDISNYVLPAASAMAAKNDLDSVQIYADMITVVDPANAQAPILVMQCANNLKKYDVVIAQGEKSIEVFTTPEDISTANMLLGVAYQNKGNDSKAIAALSKVTTGASVAQAKQIISDIKAAQ